MELQTTLGCKPHWAATYSHYNDAKCCFLTHVVGRCWQYVPSDKAARSSRKSMAPQCDCSTERPALELSAQESACFEAVKAFECRIAGCGCVQQKGSFETSTYNAQNAFVSMDFHMDKFYCSGRSTMVPHLCKPKSVC